MGDMDRKRIINESKAIMVLFIKRVPYGGVEL
jgi:hypothetical protein